MNIIYVEIYKAALRDIYASFESVQDFIKQSVGEVFFLVYEALCF